MDWSIKVIYLQKLIRMKSFLLLLSIACVGQISAQVVDRGPYLQMPNHESIVVKWRTITMTTSKVWYGTDSTNLNQFVQSGALVSDHELKITGLNPSTKYYYKIGNTSNAFPTVVSKNSFTTHPLPGTSVPTRIWAIGDFGRGNQGQIDCRTSYEAYTGPRGTDVWLWLGDNAYDTGTDEQYQLKVFGHTGFKELFSYMPFWPSPGNHDYMSVWSESTLLGIPYQNISLDEHVGPYFDIVTVPQQAECGGVPSNLEVFYSFDYGDVHLQRRHAQVHVQELSSTYQIDEAESLKCRFRSQTR